MRSFLLLPLVLLSLPGCHRAIRLPPPGPTPPRELTFERGLNHRARLEEYELPQVSVTWAPIHTVTLSGLPVGVQNVDLHQTRTFTLQRGGVPLMQVVCEATQRGTQTTWGSLGRDDSRHEYHCRGNDFTLDVIETGDDVYAGSATRGGASLELHSTNDMAEGIADTLSGFHLTRGPVWLGAFECFFGGSAWLLPQLTPLDRELAELTMLAIVSTDGWLGRSATDNVPGRHGG
jgi:hypothetical protein